MFNNQDQQAEKADKLRKSLPDMDGDFKLPEYAKIKVKDHKSYLFYGILTILIVLFVIFSLNFRTVKVDGHSMDNTLHNGEIFIAKKHEPIKRFEIVVLDEREKNNGPSKDIVKRVIGLPGDRVTVMNGQLFINNKYYKENYVDPKNAKMFKKLNWTIKVPKGYVFVLGDNRDISKDSRIEGCFKESSILGVKTDIGGK